MIAECSICEELKRLSIDTWKRIGFVRTRKGLKIYETTITQNLLFELKKFSELCPTNVQIYEATNEKVNGNDIEIFLQVGSHYIYLPTQAKILYKNSKYTAMDHGNQINDLILYSKRVGGFPLYLLYNYDNDRSLIEYGCSLIPANYLLKNFAFARTIKSGVKRWTIPSFKDLHPTIALPWHNFFCTTVTITQRTPDGEFSYTEDRFTTKNLKDESLKYYTLEDLTNDVNWKEFSLKENIVENINSETNIENKYSPRFRLILSFNKQDRSND